MKESEVDRKYRLYVENPYVWISPFEAYAQAQYEIAKIEKDRKRLESEVRRLAPFQHAARGIVEEKILDLKVSEFAVRAVEDKF